MKFSEAWPSSWCALLGAGLTEKDITPVLLQHADGTTALIRGDIDAWAGLGLALHQAGVVGAKVDDVKATLDALIDDRSRCRRVEVGTKEAHARSTLRRRPG